MTNHCIQRQLLLSLLCVVSSTRTKSKCERRNWTFRERKWHFVVDFLFDTSLSMRDQTAVLLTQLRANCCQRYIETHFVGASRKSCSTIQTQHTPTTRALVRVEAALPWWVVGPLSMTSGQQRHWRQRDDNRTSDSFWAAFGRAAKNKDVSKKSRLNSGRPNQTLAILLFSNKWWLALGSQTVTKGQCKRTFAVMDVCRKLFSRDSQLAKSASCFILEQQTHGPCDGSMILINSRSKCRAPTTKLLQHWRLHWWYIP